MFAASSREAEMQEEAAKYAPPPQAMPVTTMPAGYPQGPPSYTPPPVMMQQTSPYMPMPIQQGTMPAGASVVYGGAAPMGATTYGGVPAQGNFSAAPPTTILPPGAAPPVAMESPVR